MESPGFDWGISEETMREIDEIEHAAAMAVRWAAEWRSGTPLNHPEKTNADD